MFRKITDSIVTDLIANNCIMDHCMTLVEPVRDLKSQSFQRNARKSMEIQMDLIEFGCSGACNGVCPQVRVLKRTVTLLGQHPI